jgi:flagellar motor switch protein FliM
VFDQTTFDVADALRLRPNDIIPLTKPLNGIVRVEVDSEPWFTAQLGEFRNRKAVKIIELIDAAAEHAGGGE